MFRLSTCFFPSLSLAGFFLTVLLLFTKGVSLRLRACPCTHCAYLLYYKTQVSLISPVVWVIVWVFFFLFILHFLLHSAVVSHISTLIHVALHRHALHVTVIPNRSHRLAQGQGCVPSLRLKGRCGVSWVSQRATWRMECCKWWQVFLPCICCSIIELKMHFKRAHWLKELLSASRLVLDSDWICARYLWNVL